MLDDPGDRILDHIDNRRYGQAQYELRRLLAEDEYDATSRSLLAVCLAELDHFEEAVEQAQRAVAGEPDEPYCVWVLAVVLAGRRQYKAALEHAKRAVHLDPGDADYWAVLARCHAGLGSWQDAIHAAEQGLEQDPDNLACGNLRAAALQFTSRHTEAEQAFVDTSALDPENAYARAGRGWAALHSDPSSSTAIAHFYHALHLDPHSEWAKTGLLAALKARNPIYRAMLGYFLWSQSLTPRARGIFIFGGIIGYRVLRNLVREVPNLGPAVYPILGAWVLFILLSWTADPLFDFLLRFDPEGRKLVDRDRHVAANVVAGAVGTALVVAIAALLTGSEQGLMLALVCGILVIPIAAVFKCDPGWPRTTMATYTTGIALCGLAGAFVPGPAGGLLLVVGILGAVAGSWLGTWLMNRVPAH